MKTDSKSNEKRMYSAWSNGVMIYNFLTQSEFNRYKEIIPNLERRKVVL